MSSFLQEEVPPVRPLSIATIEEIARCFLEQLCPDNLSMPTSLDVMDLMDNRLPDFGIHVCPASREELGDRDGATDPQGNGEINILVTEDVWNNVAAPVPTSHYARTTVCHEIGHAVLHVPVLRRRLLLSNALARTQRANLRAYEDPEWQAWTFAGAVLMPSATLRMMQHRNGRLTPQAVSQVYGVSEAMAQTHLRRLKWTGH